MLGAPAVIVSEGGVGRPIDEIVLNKSLFERSGVTVAGAIVNKVDLLAKPDLARTLERGLARHGIRLLGVLPYRPILSNPTLAMVLEGVNWRDHPSRPGPRPGHRRCRASGRWSRSTCSSASDRAPWSSCRATARTSSAPSSMPAGRRPAGGDAIGLVLTGGYRPRSTVLDAIRYADLFATLVDADTYQVASEIHDLLVKTHAADEGKIAEIKALVWEYLFIDRILEVAAEARLD